MRRLVAFSVLLILVCLFLTGCWDYRGLNNMSMVMGMAIDRDFESNLYKITCEIADIAKSGGDNAMSSKTIESEGTTVFEAVRNAKRKLQNKLYFGHMGIIAIGEKTAREYGIANVMDWLKRDAEVRETTIVLIAKETDARNLIVTKAIDQAIVSSEIMSIILEDNDITLSTVNARLIDAYATLNCNDTALTLPAVHITENDGKSVPEVDGAAIFDSDRLVGFLSAEETKWFILAQGKASGGLISVSASRSGTPDTSLEILDTKSNISYEYNAGGFTFTITTNTNVFLGETTFGADMMDQAQISSIEQLASNSVASGIMDMIQNGQRLYGEDILGFGALIHKKDFKLWREIENDWPYIYPNVSVVVNSTVTIKNTSTIGNKKEEWH